VRGRHRRGFIAEARSVLATGTHLSPPAHRGGGAEGAAAGAQARAQTALDIDYRPNLWGRGGHGEGESRFVESAAVTAKLQATLHLST
jgi:5-dehydro-2-deoxygluconokinase